jgi:hypothetical protein
VGHCGLRVVNQHYELFSRVREKPGSHQFFLQDTFGWMRATARIYWSVSVVLVFIWFSITPGLYAADQQRYNNRSQEGANHGIGTLENTPQKA